MQDFNEMMNKLAPQVYVWLVTILSNCRQEILWQYVRQLEREGTYDFTNSYSYLKKSEELGEDLNVSRVGVVRFFGDLQCELQRAEKSSIATGQPLNWEACMRRRESIVQREKISFSLHRGARKLHQNRIGGNETATERNTEGRKRASIRPISRSLWRSMRNNSNSQISDRNRVSILSR